MDDTVICDPCANSEHWECQGCQCTFDGTDPYPEDDEAEESDHA